MRVLVIEDDELLNEEIKNFLKIKCFDVVCVTDGEKAICQIDKKKFDLYIIDIYIPNINGLDVLKFIRKVDISTPVIIMSGSLEIETLTQAYKYGCNEYIKKPFHLKELEIRMNKLINSDLDDIVFNDSFIYSKEKNSFLLDSQVLDLRKKEKRLLEILISNVNKTVSSEVIIDYVWEHEIKESYSLRQLVNGIRRKLPKNIIKTDIGVGYAIVNS